MWGAPPAGGDDAIWDAVAQAFAEWRDDGDNDALNRLVRLLTPVLWQIVRAYGVSRPEAEDIVQSTWLALMGKADTVREPHAVGRWITTVARREAWRVSRRGRREWPADLSAVDDGIDPAPDPAVEVVGHSSVAQLWRHVAQLPERCRRLLRVIAFAERPDYATLSAEMDMPVGAIGPTRGRCLEKLRRSLDGDPEWSDR
ncbi:sigma-70 family RNA polymerase sigma factor [Dactylosporangium sp. NBC_01737]|uniref:RNA polymerase sigma factor n=1 Tax=Dactylosporangium sp. NBC_01737 TaxID=2975959 RepID=UPI002E130CF0|nr:sigma-70 family RNA polymerase sigma factor [Dactylosporangium sp. NBC_01737]